jgi:hypothetical protein
MLWAGVFVMSLVAIIMVVVAVLMKRPVDADELGSVSDSWIAEHRAD